MNKCLITKLAGTVNNDSLLKIGELRLSVSTVDSPSKNSQGMYITTNQNANLTITGNGYFTDETLSENKGKTLAIRENTQTLFYVSNSNVSISLDNKYALTSLFSYASVIGNISAINIGFDISSLIYSRNLTKLILSRSQINGDISSLSDITSLNKLEMGNTNVNGNISALSNLVNLQIVKLRNTQINGNISSLAGLASLTALDLANTQVYGNISSLANLTEISVLDVPNVQSDLAVLVKFSKLGTCSLKNGNVSGDISKLASTLFFFSCKDSTTNLTWTARDSSANIIAIEGSPRVDNIDKMLQDLANCKAAFPADVSYYKAITVTGTRTSASDTAVQTLQSKGYTVSIIPA